MIRLALAAAAATAAIAAGVMLMRTTEPDYRPWPPVAGLRALPAGTASVGAAVFAGLEPPPPAALPAGDLCPLLFREQADDAVPVAYFTDHYCPNCRTMAEVLAEQGGIALTRHELPLLGSGSVVAARAALAAERQGALPKFHARMRRAAFAPTEAYLRDVAEGLGLDADRLLEDMRDPAIAERLEATAALARRMGIGAVPTTLVGRTIVVGSISSRQLDRLIERETEVASPCPIPAG